MTATATPTQADREQALELARATVAGAAALCSCDNCQRAARVMLALAAENEALEKRVRLAVRSLGSWMSDGTVLYPLRDAARDLLKALATDDAKGTAAGPRMIGNPPLRDEPKPADTAHWPQFQFADDAKAAGGPDPHDGKTVHIEHPANALAREALEREGYTVLQWRKAEPYKPKVGERVRLASSPDPEDGHVLGKVLTIRAVDATSPESAYWFCSFRDRLTYIHRDAVWEPVAAQPEPAANGIRDPKTCAHAFASTNYKLDENREGPWFCVDCGAPMPAQPELTADPAQPEASATRPAKPPGDIQVAEAMGVLREYLSAEPPAEPREFAALETVLQRLYDYHELVDENYRLLGMSTAGRDEMDALEAKVARIDRALYDAERGLVHRADRGSERLDALERAVQGLTTWSGR